VDIERERERLEEARRDDVPERGCEEEVCGMVRGEGGWKGVLALQACWRDVDSCQAAV
jgi:hypothetical protein